MVGTYRERRKKEGNRGKKKIVVKEREKKKKREKGAKEKNFVRRKEYMGRLGRKIRKKVNIGSEQ